MEFVWYFYFWLHVSVKWSFLPFSSPSLSLFCFFPIVFLDPRYIGMTGQSAVCARFVALSFLLSFSYPLLLHLLVCDWFILIYFLLIFWLWVNLKFFFFFLFFFVFVCLWWVGGVCLSRYMACTSIMYWKWVPSPPIPECMIVSVLWAKET